MTTGNRFGLLAALCAVGGVGYYLGRESVKSELRQSLGSILGGSATSAPNQSLAPAASSTPSVAPVDTHEWQMSETTSPMDDSRTVTLSLDANESITAWPAETLTPTLIIRCKEKETNLYVVNGTAANVEYGNTEGATVRLRLDSHSAIDQSWSKSTDDKALFAPSPVSMARKIAAATRMTYQFTPFNSSPQTTTFSVAGLAAKLTNVADACGWKVGQ